MEHDTTFEGTPVDLLPRSRLFNLPMRGTCGASQESLMSYAHRLSAAHQVAVRQLMMQVVLPASGLDTLLTTVQSTYTLDPRTMLSMSGAAAGARKLVQGLEDLTSRDELANGTYLGWGSTLIGQRIKMSATRRWCPQCVAGQDRHEPISFSLLWAPEVVKACPIHRVPLREYCAHCNEPQPILGDWPTHGVCSKCRMWLGDDRQCAVSEKPEARDLFIAEAVAEMIEMQRGGLNLDAFGPLHQHFERIAKSQFNQSVFKLAKRLGLAENTLSWRRRLELSTFVEVAYRLGLKPAALLSGTEESKPLDPDTAKTHRVHRRMSKDQIRELRLGVAKAVRLQRRDTGRVIGMLDLAQQFGVETRQLYSHCPNSVKAIQSHNARARPLERAAKREQAVIRAREVVRDLVSHRVNLTSTVVNKALQAAGVHWSFSDAIAAANDELDKLLKCAA